MTHAKRGPLNLAIEPKATLFDEHTSASNSEMIKEVLDAMIELARIG